ncbi:hypothetical protein [Haloferax sp. DFSO52]|uniref:hypothetical protein n=1 Tax=Haloferax sp. DFSO52 TaxID=3388505 RepID=UPI003A87D5F2
MFQSALLDLDGTVYRSNDLLPGAAEGIDALRDAGVRVLFVSKLLDTSSTRCRTRRTTSSTHSETFASCCKESQRTPSGTSGVCGAEDYAGRTSASTSRTPVACGLSVT